MNFVFFSTLTWDEAGGAHSQTQSSLALARRGHSVLFVEPQPSTTRETGGLPIQIVALTELGMTPIELRRAWFGLPTGAVETVARNLTARLPGAGGGAAVFYAPFESFVRLVPVLRAQGYTIVYTAADDFAAAPALGYTQFLADAEMYLARESDLIVAVTPHIAGTFETRGIRATVLPNGIDVQAWRRNEGKPADIKRGAVTVGFWGTVMESMFDADLIAYAAKVHPDWMFHLLGSVDPEPHRPSIAARLQEFPNVVLHGRVPHQELARYAAEFDVCIAPFPDNAFSWGRDPIKVYEYLAAHVPVVATYTPQLAHMPYVRVACAPDEFVDAIQEAALTGVNADTLDAYLAEQSWDARVGQLVSLIEKTLRQSVESDAKPLPSFAKPDMDTVLRYADALELELEQVQHWAREMEAMVRARNDTGERIRRWIPTLRKRR
jgi:glycosyltransferase involved in cell wall biosynthesis